MLNDAHRLMRCFLVGLCRLIIGTSNDMVISRRFGQ
jgi:hypothetical protein